MADQEPALSTVRALLPGDRVALLKFDGDGRCIEIALRRADGSGLRAGDLRGPWAKTIDVARRKLASDLSELASDVDERLMASGFQSVLVGDRQYDFEDLVALDAATERVLERRRPRKAERTKPEGFYLHVARVYAEAVADGSTRPTKEVWRWARRAGDRRASPNTAAQWVLQCRPGRLGYLTDAPAPRRPGGRLTPKARAALRRLESS